MAADSRGPNMDRYPQCDEMSLLVEVTSRLQMDPLESHVPAHMPV